MTTEELVTIQTEIKKLNDDFDAYRVDWIGAKVRFVKLADNFTSNVAAPTQQEIPQAEASAQPTEENASTADDNQAAEENVNSRADDFIPAADEIARASTSGVPEENEEVRQLHQLCLKKINHIPLLLLRLLQLQSFHLHQM